MIVIQRKNDGIRVFPQTGREWAQMRRWWAVYADESKDTSGKSYYTIRSWGVQEFLDFGFDIQVAKAERKSDQEVLRAVVLGRPISVEG